MKKVLIICDLFPPAFGPRMGYLCKYLKHHGWEPVILTEAVDEKTFTFLAGKDRVTYVNYYTAKNPVVKKLQWISTLLLDLCFGYKDIRMYNAARKLVKENKFDLILCSSFRTFPLPAAQKVAEKYKLPLVVDLRDVIEQYTGDEFISHALPSFCGFNKLFVSIFKRKSLRDRNRVLQKAGYVTTISPWHVDVLKQYNPKVELIYNGFDPELFYPEQKTTDQFIITYTGRLLSTAMRDPSLLLDALATLSAEKFFTEKDCKIALLDIEMPGVNGLEAAEQIREKDRDCSIIFLTAFDEFSYAKRAISVHALDYLLKPGTEEELVAVLEEAIRLLEEKADGSQKNVREKPVDMQEKKKDAELENGNVRMSAVAENIRQYIDMHYKEDISLQSVAEKMNYSDAYFCKIFKQCFDKSFIGYLTEYRLERAKQLLADVRINVKDISVNVGYRDSNYFAKVFKRAMGSTPTEYRMEILKQMNKGNTAGGLG